MRHLILVFVFAALAGAGVAQQSGGQSTGDQPLSPTTHGSLALIFPFDGFSLSSFSTGCGIKYWTSEHTAISATLTLSTTTNDNTYPVQPFPTYTSSTSTATMTAGLAAAYTWHMHVTNTIIPYLGGGAGFSYGSTKNSSTTNAGSTTENKSHTTTITVNGILGVEYFFTRSLSLAGQHTIGFSSQTTTVDAGYNYPNGTGTTIGIGTSSLILAIYL